MATKRRTSLKTRQMHRSVWAGEATFATTMLLLFADTYGTTGFEWLPETRQLEIESDFDVELPQANLDRLETAIALATTDDFYQSLPDFVTFCNILSGDTVGGAWDPADAGEVAWGITEAMIIDPPEDDEPFSEDILVYIGAVLDSEGIIKPPDILKIGVRQTNFSDQVDAAFSDDPVMFGAISGMELEKTEQINSSMTRQIRLLTSQLEALPLSEGDAKDAISTMLQAIK